MPKLLYAFDMESGVGGWGAVNAGNTITSDATQFHDGAKSVKCVTDGTVGSQGTFVNNASGTGLGYTEGTVIDYSVWVLPANGSKVTLYKRLNLTDGTAITAQTEISATGDGSTWQQLKGQMVVPVGKKVNAVAIGVRTFIQEATTFFVDQPRIEVRTSQSPRPNTGSQASDGFGYALEQGHNEAEAIKLRDALLATNGR